MGGIATVAGRGRKPKPTKLKQLGGNAGKRALNKNEPQFDQITNIEPPKWLEPLAVEMWQRVVPQLCANDLLTVGDLHNVEAFCMAYARWRQAQESITLYGVVTTNPETGALLKNPAVTVVNEASRQMIQFGSLLGLDPSSRARLIGTPKNETTKNAFAEF